MQLLFCLALALSAIFGGGLFLVPLLPLIGAAIFFYYGKRAQSSGWVRDNKYGHAEGTGKLPWYEIGQLWFAAILAAFAIVFFIAILAAR